MAERLDIEHDLPAALAEALRDDRRTVGTLYNELQDLSDEQFRERFEDTFHRVTDAATTDADLLIVVLGLAVAIERDPFITDSELVSIHEPTPAGGVETLVHTTSESEATDSFVMLPIRPNDCPPGSGQSVSDLSFGEFREIVSAMLFKRFDLLDSDLESYRDSYLRPLVRGLEAYDS